MVFLCIVQESYFFRQQYKQMYTLLLNRGSINHYQISLSITDHQSWAMINCQSCKWSQFIRHYQSSIFIIDHQSLSKFNLNHISIHQYKHWSSRTIYLQLNRYKLSYRNQDYYQFSSISCPSSMPTVLNHHWCTTAVFKLLGLAKPLTFCMNNVFFLMRIFMLCKIDRIVTM
jgi:hypothetical protein